MTMDTAAVLEQDVLIVRDLARPDEVSELCRTYDAAKATYQAGKASLSVRMMSEHAELIAAEEIVRTVGGSEAEVVAAIRSRIVGVTKDSFAAPDIMPHWSAFCQMSAGASVALHADAERLTPNGWEENHAPWLSHVGLLYLNSAGPDFHGGDLVLPEIGRRIRPTSGLFVSFPSGRNHQHEVTTIESGARLSFAVWFTRDVGRREPEWPA